MIEFIFQLITVQDINTFPDEEDRFNRAFRYKNGEKYEEAIDNFNSYIRGGVEYLHNKIFDSDKKVITYDQEDILNNMFEFVKQYNEDINFNGEENNIESIINKIEKDQ